MILYTIGKRIKNFIKVTVLYDFKKDEEIVISGEEFLRRKSILKDGKVCWYYENGVIKSKCSYKNNLLEGISIHYYKSGKVKAKENYKMNKLEGLSIRYYEDGKVMSEENYRNEKLISRVSFDLYGKKNIEKST